MLQRGPAAVCSASAQDGTAPWGIQAQQGKRWLYLRLTTPTIWTVACLSDMSWDGNREVLPGGSWPCTVIPFFHVRLDSCHFPWSPTLELSESSSRGFKRHHHQDVWWAQCSSSTGNTGKPSDAEWWKLPPHQWPTSVSPFDLGSDIKIKSILCIVCWKSNSGHSTLEQIVTVSPSLDIHTEVGQIVFFIYNTNSFIS